MDLSSYVQYAVLFHVYFAVLLVGSYLVRTVMATFISGYVGGASVKHKNKKKGKGYLKRKTKNKYIVVKDENAVAEERIKLRTRLDKAYGFGERLHALTQWNNIRLNFIGHHEAELYAEEILAMHPWAVTSRDYVRSLTETQKELLWLWTKCPSLLKRAANTTRISAQVGQLANSDYAMLVQMDEIFKNAPVLQEDIHLYRSIRCVNRDTFKQTMPHWLSATTAENHTCSRYGCTWTGGFGTTIHLHNLVVPRGTPVLLLAEISAYPWELEVLLPRNSTVSLDMDSTAAPCMSWSPSWTVPSSVSLQSVIVSSACDDIDHLYLKWTDFLYTSGDSVERVVRIGLMYHLGWGAFQYMNAADIKDQVERFNHWHEVKCCIR